MTLLETLKQLYGSMGYGADVQEVAQQIKQDVLKAIDESQYAVGGEIEINEDILRKKIVDL